MCKVRNIYYSSLREQAMRQGLLQLYTRIRIKSTVLSEKRMQNCVIQMRRRVCPYLPLRFAKPSSIVFTPSRIDHQARSALQSLDSFDSFSRALSLLVSLARRSFLCPKTATQFSFPIRSTSSVVLVVVVVVVVREGKTEYLTQFPSPVQSPDRRTCLLITALFSGSRWRAIAGRRFRAERRDVFFTTTRQRAVNTSTCLPLTSWRIKGALQRIPLKGKLGCFGCRDVSASQKSIA